MSDPKSQPSAVPAPVPARGRLATFIGPSLDSIKGQVNLAEMAKVLFAAVLTGSVTSALQAVATSANVIFVDQDTAALVSSVCSSAVAIFEFARRRNQGKDTKNVI